MKQINFLLIFLAGLALVLFSLENTENTIIHIAPGFDIDAPLCIELIVILQLGALLAWLYSIWSRLLRNIETKQEQRKMKEQQQQIEKLKQELAEYKKPEATLEVTPTEPIITDS